MSFDEKLENAEIAFECWFGRESTDEEYEKLKKAAEIIEEDDSFLVRTAKVVQAIEYL